MAGMSSSARLVPTPHVTQFSKQTHRESDTHSGGWGVGGLGVHRYEFWPGHLLAEVSLSKTFKSLIKKQSLLK